MTKRWIGAVVVTLTIGSSLSACDAGDRTEGEEAENSGEKVEETPSSAAGTQSQQAHGTSATDPQQGLRVDQLVGAELVRQGLQQGLQQGEDGLNIALGQLEQGLEQGEQNLNIALGNLGQRLEQGEQGLNIALGHLEQRLEQGEQGLNSALVYLDQGLQQGEQGLNLALSLMGRGIQAGEQSLTTALEQLERGLRVGETNLTIALALVERNIEAGLSFGSERVRQGLTAVQTHLNLALVQVQQSALRGEGLAHDLAALQSLGALGAEMSTRPTCQLLMACCDVFTEVLTSEGVADRAPAAVQTCQVTAQMGSEEICSNTIIGLRVDLATRGLALPTSCSQ